MYDNFIEISKGEPGVYLEGVCAGSPHRRSPPLGVLLAPYVHHLMTNKLEVRKFGNVLDAVIVQHIHDL